MVRGVSGQNLDRQLFLPELGAAEPDHAALPPADGFEVSVHAIILETARMNVMLLLLPSHGRISLASTLNYMSYSADEIGVRCGQAPFGANIFEAQ
jgi:hypothetical protein